LIVINKISFAKIHSNNQFIGEISDQMTEKDLNISFEIKIITDQKERKIRKLPKTPNPTMKTHLIELYAQDYQEK
jgi:hypothetical protein